MARDTLAGFKDLPIGVQSAMRPLALKQQRFVAAYCGEARGNASLAARIAGYTEKSCAFHGSAQLRDPQVRKAVEAWMTEFAMSAVELTARIAELAQVTPGPFIKVQKVKGADGKEQEVAALNITAENWARYQHWVRALEVDPATGNVTRLHLHNAQQAQATLAKILKLFSDAPQVTLNVYYEKLSNEELVEQIEAARAMARSGVYTTPN